MATARVVVGEKGSWCACGLAAEGRSDVKQRVGTPLTLATGRLPGGGQVGAIAGGEGDRQKRGVDDGAEMLTDGEREDVDMAIGRNGDDESATGDKLLARAVRRKLMSRDPVRKDVDDFTNKNK